MKVVKGTITASTTNGATSVVDLSSVFGASEPLRWIKCWTAGMTADGTVADARYSQGWGTRDASAIQQGGYALYSKGSSNAASDVYHAANTTFLLKLHSAATGTLDMEVDLTAMDEDSFTLTYTDAPATAVVIHYMAFGGADVAKARCGSTQLTGAAGTQDVTIAAGWSQPTLLFGMHVYGASLTDGAVPTNGTNCCFGVAVDNLNRRAAMMADRDAQAAAQVSYHNQNAFTILTNNTVAYSIVDLGGAGTWPTDGFRLNKTTHGATASQMMWLAVQGTFDVAIGSDVSLTAGSTDDIAAGFAPAGALVWGGNLPASSALNTTHADLGVWQLGGTDGTNEGCAGWSNDDAALDMLAYSYNSSSKIRRSYTPATPTLTGEADASFNGNNLRLTWSDLDTLAREFNYVILGPLSAGSVTHEGAATINGVSGVTAAGQVQRLASATVAGTSGVTAAGVVHKLGTASVAGVSGQSASAYHEARATASLSGSGSVTAAGYHEALAQASVGASGALSAASQVDHQALAVLDGTGALTASAERTVFASATLAGTSGLSATAASGGVLWSNAAGVSGTNLVLPIDTTADGARLIAICSYRGSGSGFPAPAGWTRTLDQLRGSSGRLQVFERIAASEPASYTFIASSSSTHVGVIFALKDVGPAEITSATGTSASQVAPTGTPSAAPSTVLRVAATAIATDSSATDFYTWPASVTEIEEPFQISGVNTGTGRMTLGIEELHLDTSPVGTATATHTNGSLFATATLIFPEQIAVTHEGEASLDGTGSVTASGTVTRHGAATMAASSGVSGSGRIERLAVAAIAAVSGQSANGLRITTGQAGLNAQSGLIATGIRQVIGEATIAGHSGMIVSLGETRAGEAVLIGTGSLIATPNKISGYPRPGIFIRKPSGRLAGSGNGQIDHSRTGRIRKTDTGTIT